MENGPKIFLPPQELKNDIKNLNLTNRLIRKCKTLAKEQRKRYVELGKYCEECLIKEETIEEDLNEINENEENIKMTEIKENNEVKENNKKEKRKSKNNKN